MKQSQSGVALIAVLLFLILIAVAGMIAVRQSAVDLKVATSDQAEALMINSSDSILASIELSSRPGSGNNIASQKHSVLGHFATGNARDKIGDQVSFCYRPSNQHLFSLMQSRIMKYKGGFLNNPKNAICNSAEAKDYVSARNTVMTQVVVRGMDTETGLRFSANTLGEQVGYGEINVKPRLSIHSVSVLPSLSDVSDAKISRCLSMPAGERPKDYGAYDMNMTTCLKGEGVPSTALVEDGILDDAVLGSRDTEKGGFGNIGELCKQNAECNAALGN